MVNILYRFQLALETPVGVAFVFFLFVLLVLFCIYWVLRQRQREEDSYAYTYQMHYQKIDALDIPMVFLGQHRASFFGRESLVNLENNTKAQALALPPDLCEEGVAGRFSQYTQALLSPENHKLSTYPWTYLKKGACVLVQGGLFHGERKGCSLQEFYLDRSLKQADVEWLLLNIVKALTHLHMQKNPKGQALYHGLVLPQSIFLHRDSLGCLQDLVLADHGFAYALGPSSLYNRLEQLKASSLPLDVLTQKDLEEQVNLLAPEQKHSQGLSDVGRASDFYTFAALALELFTREKFLPEKEPLWESVPTGWRSFLQRCLCVDPKKRPQDFYDLHVLLHDPDLALLHGENMPLDASPKPQKESFELKDLKSAFDRLQRGDSQSRGKSSDLQGIIDQAMKKLERAQWKEASLLYESAWKQKQGGAEVCVGLAISYYEQGLFKESEKFYHLAKEKSPLIAKRYREHLMKS